MQQTKTPCRVLAKKAEVLDPEGARQDRGEMGGKRHTDRAGFGKAFVDLGHGVEQMALGWLTSWPPKNARCRGW